MVSDKFNFNSQRMEDWYRQQERAGWSHEEIKELAEDLNAHPQLCAICGEPAFLGVNLAEMYSPLDADNESKFVHDTCGLERGWEVA